MKWAEKIFKVPKKDLPFLDQLMAERGISLEQAIDDYLSMYGTDTNPKPISMGSKAADAAFNRRFLRGECLTDPHRHILHRLHEDVTTDNTLSPNYTTNDGRVQHGDSSLAASHTKKEGEEFTTTGEETREVELADKIMAAASRMAKTPDVEQIIRLADELKKMHGKE